MTNESNDVKQLAEIHGIKRGQQTLYMLLVEDNPVDAALFQELLELVQDFKFIQHHVQTLTMAISATETQKFDCIVLDLNLPDSEVSAAA